MTSRPFASDSLTITVSSRRDAACSAGPALVSSRFQVACTAENSRASALVTSRARSTMSPCRAPEVEKPIATPESRSLRQRVQQRPVGEQR